MLDKKLEISQNDTELGTQLFKEAILEALDAFQIPTGTYGMEAIDKAAKTLWSSGSNVLFNQRGKRSLGTGLLDFAGKAKANISQFAPYSLTPEKWFEKTLENGSLFYSNPNLIWTTYKSNEIWFKKNFNVPEASFFNAVLRQTTLFSQSYETTVEKFTGNMAWAKPLGMTEEKWITLALKQPSLLYLRPETIYEKVKINAARMGKYGITEKAFLEMSEKQASLLIMSPENIETLFNGNVAWLKSLGISDKKFAEMVRKEPSLLVRKPEALQQNYNDYKKWITSNGFSQQALIKAIVKEPALLYQSPDTVKKRIKKNAKWTQPYGYTERNWIKAGLADPTVFYSDPDGLKEKALQNVRWLSPLGMTKKDWLKLCFYVPQFFTQNPKTLEEKFKKTVSLLAPYGATEASWLTIAKNHPNILAYAPETNKAKFDLALALTEMPAFPVNDHIDISLRELRAQKILKFPKGLLLAEDNMLLRMAAAEISGNQAEDNMLLWGAATERSDGQSVKILKKYRSPYKLLKIPRNELEQLVVKALGFDPDKKVLTVKKSDKQLDAKSAELKNKMHLCAEDILTDIRSRPAAEKPTPLPVSIVGTLDPKLERRPGEVSVDGAKLLASPKRVRERLLHSMIMSGLLSTYQLEASS